MGKSVSDVDVPSASAYNLSVAENIVCDGRDKQDMVLAAVSYKGRQQPTYMTSPFKTRDTLSLPWPSSDTIRERTKPADPSDWHV
jgi:hypothetical protein